MTQKIFLGLLILIGFSLLLVACLGEPELPLPEASPPPTIVPPPANPTIAAYPRISIRFDSALSIGEQQVPQIPHDRIGRSDCLMCHRQGISQAPRIPDSHRGLNNDTCQTCHTTSVSTELSGEEMYAQICARCHGEEGEGGYGPVLNSKSFLASTSDDELRQAITRGRGAPQMLAWGALGLLTERQIDELVLMLRGWEATAPEIVESSAHIPSSATNGEATSGEVLFAQYCSGCHGLHAEVAVGQGVALLQVIQTLPDETISTIIRDGDEEMPSFHAILTADDINDLLAYLRSLPEENLDESADVSFSSDVLPIFEDKCVMCHGTSGDWVATSYTEVMQSGKHAPNIIPGDPEASFLVQRLQGTQEEGGAMPPGVPLTDVEIDLIVRWIAAGAEDN